MISIARTTVTRVGPQSVVNQHKPSNVTSQGNPAPPARTSEQAPLHKPSKCPAPQVYPRQIENAQSATQATPSPNSHFNYISSIVCAWKTKCDDLSLQVQK